PADKSAGAFVLAQVVVPATRSRTYTSPGDVTGTEDTRPVAQLKNATNRPSRVMTGVATTGLVLLEGGPAPTLTRQFVPATRSRTNTSGMPLLSFGTRFDALLMKATNRPSGVMTGLVEAPFAAPPLVDTLTSVVVPATRSRTKMSVNPFVSLGTRLLASLWKTTNCPLVETWPSMELPLPPPVPLELTLTSVVVLAVRSHRNTFKAGTLLPPGTRSLAMLVNTT